MSLMQKLNLAALGAGLLSLFWYLFQIVPQMGATSVDLIGWKAPMAISIGIFLALILVAAIVLAVFDKELRNDGPLEDERDRSFERRGDAWAGHIIQAFVAVAIVLLMMDQPDFWVANVLYAGVMLGGSAGLLIRLSGRPGGLVNG